MFHKIKSVAITLACVALSVQAQTAAPVAATPTPAAPVTPAVVAVAATTALPIAAIPRNIADAAEMERRNLNNLPKHDANTPTQRILPDMSKKAVVPSRVELPVAAPAPFNPSQQMKLVSVMSVEGGGRVAGLSVMGSTFYVTQGASIGNGWVVENIAQRSVLVRLPSFNACPALATSPSASKKSTPGQLQPAVTPSCNSTGEMRSLFLDGTNPVLQANRTAPSMPSPVPPSFGSPFPR